METISAKRKNDNHGIYLLFEKEDSAIFKKAKYKRVRKPNKSIDVKAVDSTTVEKNNKYNSTSVMEENEFHVYNLNRKTTSEFTDKISYLNTQYGDQELLTYLDSTGGDLNNASKILKQVTPGSKVQLITKASGKVKPAGAVLTAAGKYGSRTAEYGTKFILTNENPYPKNSKAKDLSDDDKDTLKALVSLIGKKKRILNLMLKGRPISANEAKKCGIIDDVEMFPAEDWTKEKRIKYAKASQEQPVITQVKAEVDQEKGNF